MSVPTEPRPHAPDGHSLCAMGAWERVWVLLIAATCLLVLAGAPLPHLDGDDFFYGDIARQILASGDWITLGHPDQPQWIVDKPPVSFWLMALSIRLGGDNAVALRLWQLLMALVAMFVTSRIARMGGGREEGLLAALLLGTSLEFFYLSLNPKQDIPLSLFLALAFHAYLMYRSEGRTRAAVLAGVWTALALLSKGIVAVAVFALVVGGDLLFSRRTQAGAGHWRWRQIAVGTAAFLLMGAPWFIAGAIRQGQPFIDTFLLGGTLGVGRFFHGVTSPLPYWAAVLIVIPGIMIGVMPWAGFLPGAVQEGWRGLRAGPRSIRVCALWAGLYFLLLALSPADKMIHHLLPLCTPVAVLAARAATRADGDPRRLRGPAIVALLAAVPGTALVVVAQTRYPDEAQFFLPLLAPAVAMLLVSLVSFAVFALRGRGRIAIAAAAVAALLGYGSGMWALVRYPSVPLGPPHGSQRTVHGIGSTLVPFTRSPQWRCGPVDSPVLPTRPRTSPLATLCPTRAPISDMWRYDVTTPRPWSTNTA